jgi:hypothetical protein
MATFARNPVTGSLAYEGCITGSKPAGPSGSGACAEIPSATNDGYGLDSGLGALRSVEVSPTGRRFTRRLIAMRPSLASLAIPAPAP